MMFIKCVELLICKVKTGELRTRANPTPTDLLLKEHVMRQIHRYLIGFILTECLLKIFLKTMLLTLFTENNWLYCLLIFFCHLIFEVVIIYIVKWHHRTHQFVDDIQMCIFLVLFEIFVVYKATFS